MKKNIWYNLLACAIGVFSLLAANITLAAEQKTGITYADLVKKLYDLESLS